MTSQEAPGLGNLVRLLPISLKDIPSHSAFEQSVSTDINNKDHNPNPSSDKTFQSSPNPLARREGHPSLIEFIKAILTEATVFIDNILPRTFTEGSEKSSPPSAAKVRLLKRMISPSELRQVPWSSSKIPRNADQTVLQNMEEAWFARRSHHVNLKRSGTADIAEIDDGLMVDHSEHEKEYTPDVFDSYKVVDWDKEIQQSGEIPGYSRVGMNIYEMCHQLPFPLMPRVFPVLVVTAVTGGSDFIVVQIPIDIHTLPASFYSNGRNVQEGDSSVKRKKPVLGIYTSIERCRVLPDNQTEWTMATASDAKGWLPMWAQKLGVPGAIVKDVGYLMQWVADKRTAGRH